MLNRPDMAHSIDIERMTNSVVPIADAIESMAIYPPHLDRREPSSQMASILYAI